MNISTLYSFKKVFITLCVDIFAESAHVRICCSILGVAALFLSPDNGKLPKCGLVIVPVFAVWRGSYTSRIFFHFFRVLPKTRRVITFGSMQ